MEKNSDNKIIQSFWLGDRLSTMEKLCIESFLQNGHEFHLYTYNYVKYAPIGTILKDANEIIPKEKIFYDNRGGIASFSDWFRYRLLFLKGRIWVDMDMICIKPIDIKEEYSFATEYYGPQKKRITNAFIKAPANSEFLKDLLEFIETSEFKNIRRGAFGPSLLGATLEDYLSSAFINPPETFCPINWFEIFKLITKQDFIFSHNTYCIHLWNEMWRLGYLNKDAIYHPRSIYEQLKDKYQIGES